MDWASVVRRSLAGEALSRDESRRILAWPDAQLLELLGAAFEVRKAHWGTRVKICVLQNARSGLCPEDCHYCSQSAVSDAAIKKYRLLPVDELVDGARRASEAGARRYCIVTSGRGPSEADIAHLCDAARQIRSRYPVELCVSLGLMSEPQAVRLKEAGVGWVNHNLNTSERHHPKICTTHTYQDRLATLSNVKKAGMRTCSGGIIGMGETDEDILDMAYALRDLDVSSLPVNFLHPIEGTPFEGYRHLTPTHCLKVLCVVRLLNPRSDLRAAGGREVNLRSLQALALYPANSIFVEGYLTTPGQAAQAARQMVEDLGFQLEPQEVDAAEPCEAVNAGGGCSPSCG
jgi:biotin synthase